MDATLRTVCFISLVILALAEGPVSTPSVANGGGVGGDNVVQYVAGHGGQVYSPPTAYNYAEPNYGPLHPAYDNYLVPYQVQDDDDDTSSLSIYQYLGAILPYGRLLYRIVAKIGAFLVAGSILLVIGGLFMTALCAMTPLCTIQFMGVGLNRDTMRSYMTPDNLGAASAFVQEAIDKYQKLQGAISPKNSRK